MAFRNSWIAPATCARCPASCPIPTHKWAVSTAFTRAAWSACNRTVDWPPSGRSGMVRPRDPWHARIEGELRFDVARFGRGTDPIVRLPRARDGTQAARPIDRVFARAPAVPPGRAGPAVDRAAGLAHGRFHPRERDLFRPLLVRRQGRGMRRALAVRGQTALRG